MGRRNSKNDMALFILAVVIGVPILIISKLSEVFGGQNLAIGITLFAIFIIWLIKHGQKKRRLYLLEKYQNEETVDLIMSKSFWQGQSAEQLVDSLGEPADIDEKILKTKKKEVWKYQHEGGNRYRLRITLDNDFVVSWEQR